MKQVEQQKKRNLNSHRWASILWNVCFMHQKYKNKVLLSRSLQLSKHAKETPIDQIIACVITDTCEGPHEHLWRIDKYFKQNEILGEIKSCNKFEKMGYQLGERKGVKQHMSPHGHSTDVSHSTGPSWTQHRCVTQHMAPHRHSADLTFCMDTTPTLACLWSIFRFR